MGDIEFLIAVLFAAAVLVRFADVVSIPYPIVLVVGGVAIGFVPGLPHIALEPEAVFLIFLPPLLHSAGFGASPQELRTAAAQLVSLTLVLVLVTMCAVAVVAHAVLDVTWAEAFVLGAILGPTDPLSAAATFSRLGATERVTLAVESEAMLNDAAALVAYRLAVGAALAGTFALDEATWEFVRVAAGGVLFGLAVGWVGQRLHRRLNDPPLAIFLSVLFAYGSYIGAEELGASGVLATVVAGVWFGWHSHEMLDADTRLSALAFWDVLVFGLNATLFVLLGLQFEELAEDARADGGVGGLLAGVAIVSAAVIGVRLAWVGIAPLLSRLVPAAARADTGDDWRERLVVGWSGMRGAISLAAALALPAAVEQRELLIFVTVGVIAVTLVGQGLTLGPLVRRLGVEGARDWSPDEAIARLEAAQAALDRLDELEREGRIGEERLRRMRELYRARFRRCMAVIEGDEDQARGEAAHETAERYSALRRELIGIERGAILALRDEGRLKPDTMRMIQRDLDLEEARLPA
ncbi:MAG TPA: Na+/H+ antiporter [Solirubrobacteraceae bacterium]|nr:Na+/H+ antiporter [Solirubrobacteraceae bacterium]